MKRAYALLDIRAADDDKRTIEGIASTADIDSYNTILEPEGAQFKLPLPVLYQHNSRQPIGHVVEAKVSKDGIRVKIQVAAAGIAEFIDEAWALIKNRLVRGLSVGFDPIEEVFDKTFGGYRFPKWKWLELSTVTIPANEQATMSSVRSADEAILAALGTRERTTVTRTQPSTSPASGPAKGKPMTLAEQIAALEATQLSHRQRMNEIREKAVGRTMDAAESEEFDNLQAECEAMQKDITRLRNLEKMNVATATVVTQTAGTSAAAASAARGATGGSIQVRGPQMPKGTGFTRYAIALHFAKGDFKRAAEIVESNKIWMSQTPEVAMALRAPVAAGDTVTTGWAAELVVLQNLASEFVELLRPMTLLGKIPGFRNVPFNVLIPRQTAGTEGDWVGEGARKPVGRLTTDNIELKHTKIAKIVAITEELARFSNPSAEARVRLDLLEGIQLRMDRTFADPSVTAQTGIRPASIFNGADTAAATGTGTIADVIADVKAAIATFTAAELPVDQINILTTPTLAVGLSLMRTTLDAPAFPGMTPAGGNLLGFPVWVSSVVPTGNVEYFIPGEVLLADDGQARIDVSNQATLIMDDGGSPSATNAANLWQENKIGIKGERFVNWLKRRDDSTYYTTGADYGG